MSPSCGNGFSSVLLMEATEDRPTDNLAILGQEMPPVTTRRKKDLRGFRNTRCQSQMGPPLIVMSDPLRLGSAKVFLTE
jgi:hypothetical protein